MVRKAQFNPSTLKAIYNSSTNKAQMAVRLYVPPNGDDFVDPPEAVEYSASDCAWCNSGETPKYLTVKIQDMVFCDGCYECDLPAYKSVSWENGPNPNGLYLLTQTAEDNCIWKVTLPVDAVIRHLWQTTICTSLYSSVPYGDEITVKVRKNVSGISLTLVLDGNFLFEGGEATPDSGCLNLAGIVNNDVSCNYFKPWSSGSAEIKEGNQMP